MKLDKITVCGGGNGAQTLAPIAACNLGCAVDMYAPFGSEARRLRAGLATHRGLEAREWSGQGPSPAELTLIRLL